jgi:pyruvate dehydrogenase E2 component (dihydrolipoamide acetyltransferase)
VLCLPTAPLVLAGDELKAGDGLAEIETDKAVVTFEQVDDGYLARVFVPDGSQDVAVGRPVALTVEEKEDIAAFASYSPPDVVKPAAAKESAPVAAPVAPTPVPVPAPVAPAPKPPPTPAPIAAAPAPASTAAPAAGVEYYAFEAWGSALVRSPIAAQIAAVSASRVSRVEGGTVVGHEYCTPSSTPSL